MAGVPVGYIIDKKRTLCIETPNKTMLIIVEMLYKKARAASAVAVSTPGSIQSKLAPNIEDCMFELAASFYSQTLSAASSSSNNKKPAFIANAAV